MELVVNSKLTNQKLGRVFMKVSKEVYGIGKDREKNGYKLV